MQKGVLRIIEGDHIGFYCPGCKSLHAINVGPGGWGFNGDYDRPTFTPSVLVHGHKIITDENGKWTGEWERGVDGKVIPLVCHSFVRDGQIQFLSDSGHELAGQTVDLVARPEAE